MIRIGDHVLCVYCNEFVHGRGVYQQGAGGKEIYLHAECAVEFCKELLDSVNKESSE